MIIRANNFKAAAGCSACAANYIHTSSDLAAATQIPQQYFIQHLFNRYRGKQRRPYTQNTYTHICMPPTTTTTNVSARAT